MSVPECEDGGRQLVPFDTRIFYVSHRALPGNALQCWPPCDCIPTLESMLLPAAQQESMTTPEPVSIEAMIADVEVDCRLRMTKIRQVSRMKDVLQLNDIRLAEELRIRAPEIRGINQLQLAAEIRMREILDGHMHELRAVRDVQSLEAARSHFLHREWHCLKGVYPLLYREAEVESDKLLGRLERELDVKRRRSR